MSRHPQASDRIALTVFASICIMLVFRHELGHDEAQAWNIARSAVWPFDVIALGRHEGHTPFWHLVLWPLTRTGMPVSMQWLSAGLAVFFAWRLLADRPFGWPITLLVLFGYFPLYEYGNVPRPYALTLALVACLATLLYRRRGSVLLRSAIVGLLAFTSAFGAAISLPLQLLVLYEHARSSSARPHRDRLLGAVVYLAFLSASVYFIVFPFASNAFEATLISGGRIERSHPFVAIVTAAFPHHDRLPFGIGAWLVHTASGKGFILSAALLSVAAVARHLRTRPQALFTWLFAVVSFSMAALYSGSLADRHLGHLYLVAILLCWARDGLHAPASAASKSRGTLRALGTAVICTVLAYHLTIAAAIAAMDVLKPMTPWKAVATWLDEHGLGNRPLLMEAAYHAGALTAYNDTTPFNMRCPCWERFPNWSTVGRLPSPDALERQYCAMRAAGLQPIVVVSRVEWSPPGKVREIARFDAGFRGSLPAPVRLYSLPDDALDEPACH